MILKRANIYKTAVLKNVILKSEILFLIMLPVLTE